MLRGALAAAGAHEAALRHAIPPLLHPPCHAIVARFRSHRRPDMAGVPARRPPRLRTRLWPRRAPSALTPSPPEPRLSPCPRRRPPQHRHPPSRPPSSRPRLHRRLPPQQPFKHCKKEAERKLFFYPFAKQRQFS